jgi:mono/diheme cytochrome c family protein
MRKIFILGGVLAFGLGLSPHAFASGAETFVDICSACHGEDGKGAEGMTGVPNFTDAPAVWAKSDDELAQSVIKGVEKPGAEVTMPPRAGNDDLTDAQIKEAVVFIRKSFGK